MSQRIVLVGAGSAQFGYGTIGDIMQSQTLEGSTIVLHDINPDTMGTVAKTAEDLISSKNLRFSVEATTHSRDLC
jgi:alpha-galactosidase